MTPGEVNCVFTKSLLPFVEKEVGPAGVATLLGVAGVSREHLVADHNWLPLAVLDRLVRVAMELMGESNEERWGRRWGDYHMDWKPTHEERSYLGAYTMGLGSPRSIYKHFDSIGTQILRCARIEVIAVRRARVSLRLSPLPGFTIPKWLCAQLSAQLERYPTNWGLPRAHVLESQCAAGGADACLWHIRWRNQPLGLRFWTPTLAGMAGALGLGVGEWSMGYLPIRILPVLLGAAVGYALVERHRRQSTDRLLGIQSDEILHTNRQLDEKFRDLETKIAQLSLLIDLSAAVNATLDPEKIYEQALQRLVDGMRVHSARLFLVDPGRGVIRCQRVMRQKPLADESDSQLEWPLTADGSPAVRVAITGRPVLLDDAGATEEAAGVVSSLMAAPLSVGGHVLGVLEILSTDHARFREADLGLLSAVANHVALAIDKAQSFQTIEDLSRGLEDKVRDRTEQLRHANRELEMAYRDLQATQLQLIQREKMASVGQLVAGVAHELNNPIGFVSSNVTTLEDFVTRLRTIVEAYRSTRLGDADRIRITQQWESLKLDYALKYLDPMLQGIREGAERARKIVRDLRVFARTSDEAWQAIDLHEELESSLTLLSHLLKDRVAVHRKFGALPSVECIRSQMDQVFLNLLANAAQAISGPGAITIETRRESGFAVIRISDTGPGIAPDVLGRIFDPFFTTKSVGEGTGLGLSISYEIVKKHGGDITAESQPGQGATLTVRIPLVRKS